MAGFYGFGNSNTEGSNFYTLYPNDLAKRWSVLTGMANPDDAQRGHNISSAYGTAGARFKSMILDKNPTSVSLMFGMVDMTLNASGVPSVSKLTFENTLNAMVDSLIAKGCKILLMTEAPVHVTTFYNRTAPEIVSQYQAKGSVRTWANSYNDIIRKVAGERGTAKKVYLVDHYANAWAKAAPGNGGAGDIELAASGLIDSTGTHWTPSGHNMMAYSINVYLAK